MSFIDFVYSLTRYENDGKWYRAVIKQVGSQPGSADVVFVDYGTFDSVKLENIRLDIMYEDIPMMAIRCLLYNVRVPGSADQPSGIKVSWPQETLDTLHSMIVDHEFSVMVRKRGPPLQVYLTSVKGRKSVTKELAKKGLAEIIEFKPRKQRRPKKSMNE